ncbi:MAG: GTP-binding protein [Syntrophorhabdaceae bacterium]|nr:GTP-binding protein [Syntrophorhabdaceae bacterium]
MEQIALPIVITGHIDHGKSTLIGRLLYDTGVLKEDRYHEITQTSSMLGKHTEFAFVLDALEEEREKGITIDTTQIYFNTQKRKYVIIDAPGHKEFLRNMITGASYAEAAVLIIDANEGIKEQTKRHAYILSMVGIREVCVLVNKMDLVDYSKDVFDRVVREIDDFFSAISIKPKFFIPISALSGINVAKRDGTIGWYDGPCLFEALDGLTFKAFEKRPLRFPIQDVYKIDKNTIYAGRIESGEVKSNTDAFVYPGERPCKIIEIKKFLKNDIKKATYGDSIGLIIKGGKPIKRGHIITDTQDIQVKKVFDANLFWFYGEYKKGDSIIIKCTTQESPCSMEIKEKFDPATMDKKEKSDTLEIGEVAKVRIKTKKTLAIDSFSYIPEMGRFIIEKNGVPVGGGIII